MGQPRGSGLVMIIVAWVMLVVGCVGISVYGEGLNTEKPKEQLQGMHDSVEEKEVESEHTYVKVSEEHVVNPKTIGLTKDELLNSSVREANNRGVQFLADKGAEVFKGDSYDTVLLTQENSPVRVTAYISKTDGLVSQVVVGSIGSDTNYQKQVKDVVKVLVGATSKSGNQNVLASNLLSVTNGQVKSEVSDGLLYSASSSTNNGMMMFIEGM